MEYLSFRLHDRFVSRYKEKEVPWGFKDAAGNSVAEIVFLRTYSRKKEDGTKERWHEVCERVVNGMYSIQKDYAKKNKLPWSDVKAHRSAEEAYDRMFNFKWTPPGRGLWAMGTPLVNRDHNSAALQNCAFVSTQDITRSNPSDPFCWLMEASMLGVGVGFDVDGGAKRLKINTELPIQTEYVIPDTREGWVESVRLLLNAYLGHNSAGVYPVFDYSQIRPAGSPISTFGGTAAGPEPLMRLHDKLREIFEVHHAQGGEFTSRAILDVANLIGVCVVSGNVRRSAELAMGSADDISFIEAKDTEYNPYRAEWAWMSNNTVKTYVGEDLNHIVEGIAINGEPGVAWMDVTRDYGRLVDAPDHKDWRVMGYNPCFHPDTIIETIDGPKKISEISEPTMVYTKGSDGKLTIKKSSAAFQTKKNAETVRVILRNGDELIVTPDHLVMRKDGSWVKAGELKPNDSLETLCRTRRGWRYSGVRLSSQDSAEQVMEHRMIWEGVHGPIPHGYDIDHINRDHHDNRIDNLRILDHGEHARLSRYQVPNNHQVHGSNGDFTTSGNHGAKPKDGAIAPPRATKWKNQFTVVAVEPGPVVDVWDITVDETHCLIANGVVAHNCAEQPLESKEMCTLVESYLNRHDTVEDFIRTLKFAYLYAKTVTLLPTHWEDTNAIMQRNRRIGTSISGIANFADNRGMPELRRWMDMGYENIRRYDQTYSEWLCVRESIRTTTVKPSGTVSILAGESPGVHWSLGGEYHMRGILFQKDDPMVEIFRQAGYEVHTSVQSPETSVFVQFPIHSLSRRTDSDVSIFEKVNLASEAQRYWSDNSVSVTVSYNAKDEAQHVPTILQMYEGKLKTVSFLPQGNDVYPQMPYQSIEKSEYEYARDGILPVDLSRIYTNGQDAEGESGCTTDRCETKAAKNAVQ